MSEHRVTVDWKRGGVGFSYETYRREHSWTFPGGAVVPASAAPGFLGDPTHVDPEEAFVAALSSCHMLTFLALAAKRRLPVDRYTDEAVGFMEKNDAGRMAEGICGLLDRPDEAASLGARGRTFVEENYDWEKVFSPLDELLERLGPGRPAGNGTGAA